MVRADPHAALIEPDIPEQLSALDSLDAATLHMRWRALTGRKAPAHLPKQILRRILAYRMQAEIFGDLDTVTARTLERIAQNRQEHRDVTPTLENLGLSTRDARALMPGTVLVREYDGHKHHVMVLEDGFGWQGTTYSSLSKVARAITGTNWNGYRFFGLPCSKRKAAQR